MHGMRIVCGMPWTVDGRWVVVGPYYEGADHDSVLFDADPDIHPLIAIQDCMEFIRESLTSWYESV
jgi:hypothetical protein